MLRLAVVLLGAQVSLTQVFNVGKDSFPVMIGTLTAALLAAWVLGRVLRIDSHLTTLIGVGTAICGASAIAAITLGRASPLSCSSSWRRRASPPTVIGTLFIALLLHAVPVTAVP